MSQVGECYDPLSYDWTVPFRARDMDEAGRKQPPATPPFKAGM
jgi:hypothetical protein